MEWIVLLFILLLVIAAVWYLWNVTQTTLAPSKKVGGVEQSDIQKEVLTIIEPYIREFGTSQITEHLYDFYEYTKSQKADLKSKLKRSELDLKPSGLKLLAILIHDICDRHNFLDPHEFIEESGIVGYCFAKPTVKARIVSAVHPYSSKDLDQIKDLIRDLLREQNQSSDMLNSILKQIESLRMYTLSKKQFIPDLLALRPIIKWFIKCQQPRTDQKDQKAQKGDLDKLIDRLKYLQLLKDYPSIRLDRIYSIRDLLDQLEPLDTRSYLEGKRDAERMFSKLADHDRELERKTEKLQQELKDKELATLLQEEERQKQEEIQKQKEQEQEDQEKMLRDEFDKLLDDDIDLQIQIEDREFSREQLYEQFKRRWVGGTENPDRERMIKIIKEILEKKSII
jgi:hypothetical protein